MEKSRSINPAMAFTRVHLAAAYALAGRLENAAAELGEARRLKGDKAYSSIALYKEEHPSQSRQCAAGRRLV